MLHGEESSTHIPESLKYLDPPWVECCQSTVISFLPLMFPLPDSPRKLLPTEQVHTEQVGAYVGGLELE